jgi:hypothetical protein
MVACSLLEAVIMFAKSERVSNAYFRERQVDTLMN